MRSVDASRDPYHRLIVDSSPTDSDHAPDGTPEPGTVSPAGGADPGQAASGERTLDYWLASAEMGVPTVADAPTASTEVVDVQGATTAAPRAAPAAALVAPPSQPVPAPRAAPTPEAPTVAPPGTNGASRRAASVVSRLAVVVVMLLVAATVGYGLAFLSAELVGRAGTVGAAASAAPSLASAPLAVPPTTPTPAVSARPTATARGSASPAASPGATPAGSPRVHVVARGENLTTIAAEYGVTVQAIAAANGIADPNTIYAGQKLVIPAP